MQPLKMPAELIPFLRCPGEPSLELRREGDALVTDATPAGVRKEFPVVDGTPVLIDEGRSIFDIADFVAGRRTTMDLRADSKKSETFGAKLKRRLARLVPSRSRSVNPIPSTTVVSRIVDENPKARILVVGAGATRFTLSTDACVLYTDVALAPDTHLIADCHDIPFADDTFDAVFAVSVIQHVADPYRCVDEMRRVLRPNGYVYAIAPFALQVHMGRFDFTRFTFLGYRRLFRWFDEVESGVANGPGMSLAWAIEYFFSTMSEHRGRRRVIRTISRFIGAPFLLFDPWLARKRGAYDCAGAFVFYGRLRASPVSDREVIASFRGLNPR